MLLSPGTDAMALGGRERHERPLASLRGVLALPGQGESLFLQLTRPCRLSCTCSFACLQLTQEQKDERQQHGLDQNESKQTSVSASPCVFSAPWKWPAGACSFGLPGWKASLTVPTNPWASGLYPGCTSGSSRSWKAAVWHLLYFLALEATAPGSSHFLFLHSLISCLLIGNKLLLEWDS